MLPSFAATANGMARIIILLQLLIGQIIAWIGILLLRLSIIWDVNRSPLAAPDLVLASRPAVWTITACITIRPQFL